MWGYMIWLAHRCLHLLSARVGKIDVYVQTIKGVVL